MSLRIRLQRVGRRNRPVFRIVVIEKREAAKGKPVDILGTYDPIRHTGTLNFDQYQDWLKKGAQPSDTVRRLYVKLSKNKKLDSEILSAISTSTSTSTSSSSSQ